VTIERQRPRGGPGQKEAEVREWHKFSGEAGSLGEAIGDSGLIVYGSTPSRRRVTMDGEFGTWWSGTRSKRRSPTRWTHKIILDAKFETKKCI
jgi:hypothetical protein